MKNKNKKAFTLIEVMVTLAIFSIVAVLLSSILIQGQKILSKIDNRTVIQDEIRTALLKIQSEAQNSSEVIVNNKFGEFDGDKWLLDNTDNTARELVRFSKDGDDTAKVYVEVNDGNKHQLIEFSINKTTNKIVENSTNILINEINGDDANSISINVKDINDSSGNKINELITINCSNIVKGEDINEGDYLVTFTNKNENVINIGIGAGSEVGNTENGNSNNNDDENTNSDNSDDSSEVEESNQLLRFQSVVTSSWPNGGEWKINLTNNTGKDIKDWSITIYSNRLLSVWGGWGEIEILGNNLYKLYNKENMWKAPIKSGETIEIKGNYQGESDLIINSISFEYSHY